PHNGSILQNFLDPPMEIPNDRRTVYHGFSFKGEDQSQDAVSTGMLRAHIEQHFLSFETFRSFYILSDCLSILICNHGFPLCLFQSLHHFGWSSLNQQFAYAHTKAKCPDQGHQYSQSTNKITIMIICKTNQSVDQVPAT